MTLKTLKPRAIAFLLMLGMAVMVWGDAWYDTPHTLRLGVNTNGDTAAVYFFTPTAADSFDYLDTIAVGEGASLDSAIASWLSPVQKMKVRPGVDDSYTYTCSIVFVGSTDTLAFDWTSPAANTTIDTVIDSMVYYINNTTDLKDSVVASDSGSYFLITSLFGSETFGGNWYMVVADSLADTTSRTTTVAMVCDSMVSKINAFTTVGVTAANSGDTMVTLTADDPGLPMRVHLGDTNTVLDTLQDFTQSHSTVQDTFRLQSLIHTGRSFNKIYGEVIIAASDDTAQGLGDSDSGYIWLYTVFNSTYHLVDSVATNAVPCTLSVNWPDSTAYYTGTDTLFKQYLDMVVRVADSASDTTFSTSYQVQPYYILKEK